MLEADTFGLSRYFELLAGMRVHRYFHYASTGQTVQVHEYLAIFGPVFRTDNAALFENINHAGRTGVTETEPALEHGGGSLAFLFDNAEAPGHQFLVLLGHVIVAAGGGGHGFVEPGIEGRFSLRADIIDDAVDFFVGNEDTLGAHECGGAGR